jgi:hypothetical protein
MKTCTRCKETKELSEFSPGKAYADGRATWCRACVRVAARQSKLRVKYGITAEEYARMFAEQDGKCAICGRTGEETGGRWQRLGVDHDHQTDAVRGLLCAPCNSAIGLLQDDPEIVMAAAAYLLAHQPATEGAR